MDTEILNIIRSNPHIYSYLREDSSHYKYLLKDKNYLRYIDNLAKEKYKLIRIDKLDRLSDNLKLIEAFLDVMK